MLAAAADFLRNGMKCRVGIVVAVVLLSRKKIENKKATSYVVDSFSNHHHLDMLSVV